MITLLTMPAGFGQFSYSPFCVKAAYLLSLSGMDWQRRDVPDPRRMPQGKLPVLETADGMIPGSDAIRDWLISKGADFDAPLEGRAQAEALAVTRMAEEHLYFQILMDRWGDDAIWARLREAAFGSIPGPLRGPVAALIRRDMMRTLRGQGVARMPAPERLARVDADLTALATLLGEGPFLFADRPTSADASVAAMLGSLGASPIETAMSARFNSDGALTGYLARMNEVAPLP